MLSFLLAAAVVTTPTVDPIKDHFTVCALQALDSARLTQEVDFSAISPVLENYLAATTLSEAEKTRFREDCEFFNNGTIFGIGLMLKR